MAGHTATELQFANVAPPEDPPASGQPPADHASEDLQTGTEHAANGHEGKAGLPQLDTTTFAGQIFWLLISFAILYFVISRIAAPKISGVISARAGRIKGDIDEAAAAKRASEAAIAAYEKALADARTRALKLGDEIRKDVQADADKKNAVAAQQLAADALKAEKRIADMRTAAMARIGDVARETAGEIVSKLTGEAANISELDAAVRGALKRA